MLVFFLYMSHTLSKVFFFFSGVLHSIGQSEVRHFFEQSLAEFANELLECARKVMSFSLRLVGFFATGVVNYRLHFWGVNPNKRSVIS